jgi:hypothetical protein
VGDLDPKRCTAAPTARWTITPSRHAACGNVLRPEMVILAEIAIPVEMTPVVETILKEATRKCATNDRMPGISDPIVLPTNDRRKPETVFAKEQLQVPPLEIEISCNYPVKFPLTATAMPIQLGSLIPGALTIYATMTVSSSQSRYYAHQCSLNLVMITP